MIPLPIVAEQPVGWRRRSAENAEGSNTDGSPSLDPSDPIPTGPALVAQFLDQQKTLSAVDRFSQWHRRSTASADFDVYCTEYTVHSTQHDTPRTEHEAQRTEYVARYRSLLPATPPAPGQQYAFEVDLDRCSGCKACVVACHTLNGLDENETWRDVGLLIGG